MNALKTKMELRPYQREAVDAVYRHLREYDDNPVVVIPTAGGKTPVIATICDDAVRLWGGRVLVLAHVKELLEQTVDKLNIMAKYIRVGVYSAGLNRRDMTHPVIVAGIQSVHKRACDLCGDTPFDLVLIDEAHLIPPDGEGMYRSFLADMKMINPNVRVIGLTATPFRLSSGMICDPDHFLNRICYEVGVRELIVKGYLCPLRSKAGVVRADTSGLHIRGGEFVAGEVEGLMNESALVSAACREIVQKTQDRRSVLIFAAGVDHGQNIVDTLQREHGIECGFVTGETPSHKRDELLARFKGQPPAKGLCDAPVGPLKYLCNVNVLTTGFDSPSIDCVAMLRPTMSPGLYYQMVGRGFRLCEGKADCLVLDFGSNILRHGPVDDLKIKTPGAGGGDAPAKECPECQAVVHAAYANCPDCGYAFPPPEKQRHDATAASGGILKGESTDTEYTVSDFEYSVHVKRDAPDDAPRTMRVTYRIGWNKYVSEWVCFEHTGFARAKAEVWWRDRSDDPIPDNVDMAVDLAEAGSLAPTLGITVRRVAGEKYDRVVDYKLGPKPPPVLADNMPHFAAVDPDTLDAQAEPEFVPQIPDDEIPF